MNEILPRMSYQPLEVRLDSRGDRRHDPGLEGRPGSAVHGRHACNFSVGVVSYLAFLRTLMIVSHPYKELV